MIEGDAAGMQVQARRSGTGGLVSIEVIAQDRMADFGEVHAQLVRTTGERGAFICRQKRSGPAGWASYSLSVKPPVGRIFVFFLAETAEWKLAH